MANLLGDFINGVYSYGNTGSSMANAVSAGAQRNQQNFNAGQADLAYERDLNMLNMQSAYNSAEAAAQREYNTAMWQAATEANRENAAVANAFAAEEAAKNRQFQAEQAKLTRDWQERMSNTAYQRAVADMKAAGINPILAAMNGGASAGSGATASGSAASASMANSAMASSGMASMSAGSAPMASSSNYTGQGNNMSENLAMVGAIASMFGSGMSGMASALGQFAESFDLVKLADSIDENFGELLDTIYGDQGSRAKNGDLTPYEEKYLKEHGVLPGYSIWEILGLKDPVKEKYNQNNTTSGNEGKTNQMFWDLFNNLGKKR